MKNHKQSRTQLSPNLLQGRLAGTLSAFALTTLLSACATQQTSVNGTLGAQATPKAGEAIHAIGYDATSKSRAPREGRKRDRASISAEFNLGMEANENGPPSVRQLFQAAAQRDAIAREYQSRRPMEKLAGVTSTTWQALGPGNVGGRLRAITFDPRNAARIFVGAASGGVWLSEDGAVSWRPINDFLGSLSVTSIVIDPANPNIMFAGTGEGSAGLVGAGIFKSVDSGLSWTQLANTSPDVDMDWRFVNRIAMHPQQTNIMLAGTTNGINSTRGAVFRTNDGGASWTKVANFKTPDIAFDPNDPNNAVAGRDDGYISYSRDAGRTWQTGPQLITQFTGRPSNSTARAEIAYARSRPGMIYASVDHEKGEVWRSTDGGETWNMLSRPQHTNNQGDYDNAIWVDPFNENTVLVGGLDLHRSLDGGVTFLKVSDWRFAPYSAHADHHAIVAPPTYSAQNPVVYFGNDGGLYFTANVYGITEGNDHTNGWLNMNNGLAVTQFYAGAGKRSAGGRIIGGTQDNGSLQLRNGEWSMWRGGDGGFSAVDPENDTIFYGEYVYLSIHRSLNGGASSSYICNGITEGKKTEGSSTYCGANATEKTNFISPFVLDPNNSNRIVAGANSLWVTDNAKSTPPSWRTIKAPYTGAQPDNFINAVTVAAGNSNVIWVGHNGGQVFKSSNGLAETPEWTMMQGLPTNRRVQSILLNSADPNHAIVSYTGFNPANLWETRDGGATWSSAITGNLPNAPIFVVTRHPSNPNWLYAGTSVGVFASENGGLSWSTTNDGPANVRVRDLFWYSPNELVAVTYGRGMFKATIGGGQPEPKTVKEYYNANLRHYFITAEPTEQAAVENGGAGPGWSATGDSFKAFGLSGAPSGTSPVCRFYGSINPGPNSHFYTASAVECDYVRQLQATTPAGQPKWHYEGLVFASYLPVNGQCPAQAPVPVYRAFNNRAAQIDSNHRFTTRQSEIQALVAQGWVAEGVVMCGTP
jgi:photosystem II stability/assembly factor-like uncharacterized protein